MASPPLRNGRFWMGGKKKRNWEKKERKRGGKRVPLPSKPGGRRK